MALEARDQQHAEQIEAGISGRKRGHAFEKRLAEELVGLQTPTSAPWKVENAHLVWDSPALGLFRYIASAERWASASVEKTYWLGGLATSGEGDTLLAADGRKVTGSKSDIVIDVRVGRSLHRIGVSVKTCFNATPTNAQLYCSTASAFCELLRQNGIPVSSRAEDALRMFCGDPGYRPMDQGIGKKTGRAASDERWFWEELKEDGRLEWERLLQNRHADVFSVLLKNAYPNDPIPPTYVMHVRQKPESWERSPLAIYAISELVALSVRYQGFSTRPYQVKKGRFKGDPATHSAPRFGIVQFQPLGNTQNRNQLQFNLQASYFTKLPYGE
jgi:hypothetical protein